jgi:hypothetical protein
VVVGATQAQVTEHRDEGPLTAAGVTSLLTTGALHPGALLVGAIVVEPALEGLTGDVQGVVTHGELERREVLTGFLA